jgi:hypothetical protein
MKPCLSSVACARNTESIGSFTTRAAIPRRSASVSLAGARAHNNTNLLSRSPTYLEEFDSRYDFNSLVAQNPLHLLRNVQILPTQNFRARLNDGHVAAKATESLCKFEAGIAAADDEQMQRQMVELQRLDMRQRSRGIEAGNVWKGRVRSEVEEDGVRRKHACASVIQGDLKRFRPRETPGSHDQFRTACLVYLQVRRNLSFNHLPLPLANCTHVNRYRAGRRPELRGVTRQVRNPRARNLILAGHAGDVGTGASNPPPLHDGSSSS